MITPTLLKLLGKQVLTSHTQNSFAQFSIFQYLVWLLGNHNLYSAKAIYVYDRSIFWQLFNELSNHYAAHNCKI
jgi:hypothetical protein